MDAPKLRRGPVEQALWMLAVATVMLYLIAGGLAVAGYIVNSNRIADDRADRIKACQLAYQSIIDVFEPFFPPQETERVREFRATVERYVRRCVKQTS